MSNTVAITKTVRIPEFEVEFGYTCPVKNVRSVWVRHSSGEAMMVSEEKITPLLKRMENMQEKQRLHVFKEWYCENF